MKTKVFNHCFRTKIDFVTALLTFHAMFHLNLYKIFLT
jgi:hypothetical protein